jgi:hypothetical protein
MSGVERFVAELRAEGYEAAVEGGFVVFDYEVEVGPFAGRSIRVALNPAGHPHSPPTGPFVTPRLLPIRPDGDPHPLGAVHEAAGRDGFIDPDGTWEYWSRPFNDWLQAGSSAKAYLQVHLRRLFATLPEGAEIRCAA